jgi:diaminopimelate epimerase
LAVARVLQSSRASFGDHRKLSISSSEQESALSQASRIPFVKASAYGNDFLIIRKEFQGGDAAALTRALCDRHNGIGADGVEWLSEESGFAARIHLINADGSFAELSGNGTRCVAAYLAAAGGGEELLISTDAGPKRCRLTGSSGNRYDFLTDMGEPEVGKSFEVDLGHVRYDGVPVSMGNPHFVIFVSEFPANWHEDSQLIQARHDLFPQGINVEWVHCDSASQITIRIYERGAGETMSSGTGSSASAAAAIAARDCAGRLTVIAPGGVQRVQWQPGASLMLEGSASLICNGEFFL